MTMKDDITTIKVTLGRMEEHMKNMNGSIEDAKTHRLETCPALHKSIDAKLVRLGLIYGAVVFILSIAVHQLLDKIL